MNIKHQNANYIGQDRERK